MNEKSKTESLNNHTSSKEHRSDFAAEQRTILHNEALQHRIADTTRRGPLSFPVQLMLIHHPTQQHRPYMPSGELQMPELPLKAFLDLDGGGATLDRLADVDN